MPSPLGHGGISSSPGWTRPSVLRAVGAARTPDCSTELHEVGEAGIEPAWWAHETPLEPPPVHSPEIQSRRWDSNPLRPRYEGGARPVEHRRPMEAASAGVEPTRPRFRASIPSREPGQKQVRKDSNPDQQGWNLSCYRYTTDLWLSSRPTSTGGNRTHKPPAFKAGRFAGIAYRAMPADPTGLEPAVSSVTGRRVGRATPRVQEGGG